MDVYAPTPDGVGGFLRARRALRMGLCAPTPDGVGGSPPRNGTLDPFIGVASAPGGWGLDDLAGSDAESSAKCGSVEAAGTRWMNHAATNP
jgi:hypothetical protein